MPFTGLHRKGEGDPHANPSGRPGPASTRPDLLQSSSHSAPSLHAEGTWRAGYTYTHVNTERARRDAELVHGHMCVMRLRPRADDINAEMDGLRDGWMGRV